MLTPEQISANAVSVSVYKITSNLNNDEIQQVVIRLQEFLDFNLEEKLTKNTNTEFIRKNAIEFDNSQFIQD